MLSFTKPRISSSQINRGALYCTILYYSTISYLVVIVRRTPGARRSASRSTCRRPRRVQGLGFRVQGLGLRAQGLGLRVYKRQRSKKTPVSKQQNAIVCYTINYNAIVCKHKNIHEELYKQTTRNQTNNNKQTRNTIKRKDRNQTRNQKNNFLQGHWWLQLYGQNVLFETIKETYNRYGRHTKILKFMYIYIYIQRERER